MKKILCIICLMFLITGCSDKYTIFFNTYGGTVVESQKLLDGEMVVKPVDPIKKGYIFNGWTYNGDVYNFADEVSANFTLEAVWVSDGTRTSYKVTYIIDDQKETKDVEIGGTAPEPITPYKKGYKFGGWYFVDGDDEYDFDSILTDDITLVAKFLSDEEIDNQSDNKTIIYVTDIEVSSTKLTLKVKEEAQINIVYTPNNATSKEVDFEIENKKIISVSSSGVIQGLKVGTSKITIKTVDGSLLEKEITITVE